MKKMNQSIDPSKIRVMNESSINRRTRNFYFLRHREIISDVRQTHGLRAAAGWSMIISLSLPITSSILIMIADSIRGVLAHRFRRLGRPHSSRRLEWTSSVPHHFTFFIILILVFYFILLLLFPFLLYTLHHCNCAFICISRFILTWTLRFLSERGVSGCIMWPWK